MANEACCLGERRTSFDRRPASTGARLLELTDHMVEVNQRPNPRVPALRGNTVCNLFFEDSTRTRLELRDRGEATVGRHDDVLGRLLEREQGREPARHHRDGGGDGYRRVRDPPRLERRAVAGVALDHRQHRQRAATAGTPTPLRRCSTRYTVRTALKRTGGFDGLRVAIVGDIKHSRVARSTSTVFGLLGADVTFVAPATLLPPVSTLPDHRRSRRGHRRRRRAVPAAHAARAHERGARAVSLREYCARFGLTPAVPGALGEHALVMHPGPMNRGVEIVVDPAELPGAVITKQVTNGVAVRMAVLFHLLGIGPAT